MFKSFLIVTLVLFSLSSILLAQDKVEFNVDEMAVCTSVEERQPVGADTAFAKTVGQLYCFTKVSGGSDTTAVSHIWYYNGEEMAKVDLSIKGKTWRTWSSKRIVEDWVGKWKVDVVSESGTVLKSQEFEVK